MLQSEWSEIMGDPTSSNRPPKQGSAIPPGPDPKATRERNSETVSRPGGFKNDPDDPTSPNEAIERSRRTLRPKPLPGTPSPPRK
jgi:hypothetical protein